MDLSSTASEMKLSARSKRFVVIYKQITSKSNGNVLVDIGKRYVKLFELLL